jgi:hypothetical protein
MDPPVFLRLSQPFQTSSIFTHKHVPIRRYDEQTRHSHARIECGTKMTRMRKRRRVRCVGRCFFVANGFCCRSVARTWYRPLLQSLSFFLCCAVFFTHERFHHHLPANVFLTTLHVCVQIVLGCACVATRASNDPGSVEQEKNTTTTGGTMFSLFRCGRTRADSTSITDTRRLFDSSGPLHKET